MINFTMQIDKILSEAQVLIGTAISDTGIRDILEVYGYHLAKLLKGRELLHEAIALHNIKTEKYRERAELTAEFNELWRQVDKVYMKTLKIARVAFHGNFEAGRAAILAGNRERSLHGWLEQARTFYSNILTRRELTTVMADFGYSLEKLREEAALPDQVEAKYLQQKQKTEEAEAATRQRDKKLHELVAYVSALRAIAKIALDDHPLYLTRLGIITGAGGSSPMPQAQEMQISIQ